MQKIFILLFLIINVSFNQINAQPVIDIFSIQVDHFPTSQYQDNNNNHNSSTLAGASLLLPLQINSKNTVLVGADYYQTQFKYSADTSITSHLLASSFQLGLNKQINSKWNILVVAIPKISSDVFQINAHNYQIGGAAIIKYKKRNSLKYELGLYYNREFFGNFFMPLIGIDWKINNRTYFYGEFPNILTFEYNLISNKLYTGISYKSIITSFRLKDNHNQYYVREGHPFWGDNQFRIFLNYYLINHLMFYVETGYTIFRYYQQYNNSNQKETTIPVYSRFKDKLFVGGGLAFRFRLDDDYIDK